MKLPLSVLCILLSHSVGSAFNPTQRAASNNNWALYLFGQGAKDGEKKGPGMMDQLAMFKKAQEMAQKKQKLDEELKKMDFEGVSQNEKVKASFKYVPIANPMDPNPDYEAQKFEFDDAFFASASAEELSTAVKESILNGIEKTNLAVAEKYTVLQKDLMEAFGQGQ